MLRSNKKTLSRTFMALLLALMLLFCVSGLALADEEVTLSLAIDDCEKIGVYNDDYDVYYYDEVPQDATTVTFTDFAEIMEDGTISSMHTYNSGTNIAPISASWAIEAEYIAEHFEIDEAFSDLTFEDCYGYMVMDDDYDTLWFIIRVVEAEEDLFGGYPFYPSVGSISAYVEDGYRYSDFNDEETTIDLYTVSLPMGTPVVLLNFKEDELHIAYTYDDDGEYSGSCAAGGDYEDGGKIGQATATVRADTAGVLPASVRIQTPYDQDWASETLYAVEFEYTHTFTASVDGAEMTNIAYAPNAYTYFDYMTQETVTAPVYTVTIPADTETVDLAFSHNILTYNYTKAGGYLGGWNSYFETGTKSSSVAVDYGDKFTPADGEIDYIQVQTPYKNNNSTLLYAVTFSNSATGQPEVGGGGGDQTDIDPDTLMDNIAAAYVDDHREWVVMDMAAYEDLRPNAAAKTSAAAKQNYINAAIASLDNLGYSPAQTYAKAELALRSIGIDSTRLYRLNSNTPVNSAALLRDLNIIDHYDAPWALLADLQGNVALSTGQINSLVDLLKNIQGADGMYGYMYEGVLYSDADTTATVIAALASLYDSNADAKIVVDKGLAGLSNLQGANGSLGNANTDAMAIIALAAMGIDPDTDNRFIKDGNSLLDGLLTYALADGFGVANNTSKNGLATEQGFRALIAAAQVMESGRAYNIYDFSGNSVSPGFARSGAQYDLDLRVFDSEDDNITADAVIRVNDAAGQRQSGSNGHYQLPAGFYTYTVRYDGHVPESGSFTLTGSKTIRVELESTGISVKFRLIGDDEHGDGGHGDYFTWRATRTYTVPEGSHAYDLLALALEDAGLSYTWSKGYLSAVENPLTGSKLSEFDNGPDSGWLYTVNGRNPSVGMDDYELDSGDKVIVYYSDDYTEDYDGFGVRDVDPDSGALKKELKKLLAAAQELLDETVEADSAVGLNNGASWAAPADFDKLEDAIEAARKVYDRSSSKAEDHRSAISALQKAMDKFEQACSRAGDAAATRFHDIPADHWAYPYIDHLASQGVIGGYEDGQFYPDQNIKRCDFVLMLARLSGQTLPIYSGRFNDVSGNEYYANAVAWAAEAGIIGGYENGGFQPKELISRQDMAVMLHRYAGYMGVSLPVIHPATSFTDAAMIRAYALPAVNAMSQAGIISGYVDGSFRPQGYASRAEAAKMMYMLDSYK